MKRKKIDPVAEILRQDARHHAPAFSIPLHGKIMEALRGGGLPVQPEEPSHVVWKGWAWRMAFPAAAAAALWLLWVMNPAIAPPTRARVAFPTIPAIDLQKTLPPAENAIEEAKYAYLDRDAQRLMTFVTDQLPDFSPVRTNPH